MNYREPNLPQSDMQSSPGEITVLLVDDQEFIGKIVGRMLETETDIRFHYFKNARDALRQVNDIGPTVILQDLVMPEIDGLHMVYYFRAKQHTQHTPLIVLSAHEDPKIKADAFALGANDYMVKPPDKIELIARIRYHSQAYVNRLQRDEAHRRVEEQTTKLQHTNDQLLEQISERKRIEAALRESKKKAETEREAAEEAHKKLMSSIRYAQMIQSSLLPNPEDIRHFFPNSFFIWMPRDIVGGDFIFTDNSEEGFIIAVIDCTGHGVPGAFMTMIASSGLRKIIRDEGCRDPAKILRRLSFLVKTTLQQDTEYALSDDGLDATICFISDENPSGKRTLTFAGAKLPLVHVFNDSVTLIKGDKKSIGYKKSDVTFRFTNHTIPIEKGMAFYMFTDGFVDQLGGEKRRRFGTRPFKNLLRKHSGKPFEEQREILIRAFEDHRGKNERQDDVTVVGFSLSER